MMNHPFMRYPIEQYACYVNDIDEACAKWAAMFGAGPFFMDRHFAPPAGRSFVESYRGQPSHVNLSHAWGLCGPDHHIQLIEQHCDEPSIYRDMFQKGQTGLHHIAVCLPDVSVEKARFEAAGYLSVTEIMVGGHLAVANVDARPLFGCLVELVTENPNSRRKINAPKEAHYAWDGKSDLIRRTDW